MKFMMVSNCPRCQIVRGVKLSSLHGRCQIVLFCMMVSNCPRCQIVRGVKLSSLHGWCQIVLGVKLSAVSNCPITKTRPGSNKKHIYVQRISLLALGFKLLFSASLGQSQN